MEIKACFVVILIRLPGNDGEQNRQNRRSFGYTVVEVLNDLIFAQNVFRINPIKTPGRGGAY